VFKEIIDSREQKGWDFRGVPDLSYTIGKLDTGDYAVEGLEDLCVERKRSVSELAGNFSEERWTNVLERMSSFKHPYIICEFELKDVINYPFNMPKELRAKIKVRGAYVLKRITEAEIKYGVRFVFAGKYGQNFFISLIKRLCQK